MSNGGSTPKQYGIPAGATELQDLIEYRDMNFAIGNIFKACYRLGTKNDALYEMNKVLWFAERERDRLAGVLDNIVDWRGDDSVSRLLENASALCLQAVSTADLVPVADAISLLINAREKIIEINAVFATERAELKTK